ncbi:flagellar basal body-associated FliL family protein [Aliiroseovarius sp. PTFE2010]|uniref:flagellar basal body-associated FliL family protein n=1 Tax=Aliiroseovarius sp. PTFE2010 TaxID=3417190 RepID=UPI003CF9B2F9
MADEEETEGEEPKKGSKKPLLIGLVLALVLGGGGFFAVYSGMFLAPDSVVADGSASEDVDIELPDVAFVALDPLIINTGANGGRQHLRFQAQLEVSPVYVPEVEVMLPRIIDILNGYLRAVEIRDLQDPMSLIRLRAQMLRRIQVVVGEGRVRDLLIMEFVLN